MQEQQACIKDEKEEKKSGGIERFTQYHRIL